MMVKGRPVTGIKLRPWVAVVDDYCNFCGNTDETQIVEQTRDGRSVCSDCVVHLHICEICGSTRKCDEKPEDQRHYEEECFK